MFGMKKCFALSLMGVLFFSFHAFAVITSSPVGTWLTIDDETNQPRSIVQIWNDNGKLSGKIIKVYFREGEKPTDVCEKCTDPEHKNKPILGMVILWDMQAKNNLQWGGGNILDPHNGKIYHAQIGLSPNGDQLTVRGYIGIPLLGRNQTWVRIH